MAYTLRERSCGVVHSSLSIHLSDIPACPVNGPRKDTRQRCFRGPKGAHLPSIHPSSMSQNTKHNTSQRNATQPNFAMKHYDRIRNEQQEPYHTKLEHTQLIIFRFFPQTQGNRPLGRTSQNPRQGHGSQRRRSRQRQSQEQEVLLGG